MEINHFEWNRSKLTTCTGCGNKTPYQEGICYKCAEKAPKHIPYSQHKQYYSLKRKIK